MKELFSPSIPDRESFHQTVFQADLLHKRQNEVQ